MLYEPWFHVVLVVKVALPILSFDEVRRERGNLPGHGRFNEEHSLHEFHTEDVEDSYAWQGQRYEEFGQPLEPPPRQFPQPPPKKIGWQKAFERLQGFSIEQRLDDFELREIMMERKWTFQCFLDGNKKLENQWKQKSKRWKPKGILIAAGRSTAVMNSFIVLHVLQNTLNNTLPVTLAHYGDDEMSYATKNYFINAIPGIEFMDLATLPFPKHHVRVVIVSVTSTYI